MRTLLLCLLLPVIVWGQNSSSDLMDYYLTQLTLRNPFKGNILIASHDTILVEYSNGIDTEAVQSPERHSWSGTSRRFWIGSLTKQFTAVCILLLEQRGQLSTGDHLSKYFPDFKNADSITLHQMLCHRSGMYDFEDDVKPWNSVGKILKRVKRNTPRSKPGVQFKYNDTPYLLLSLIVEKVSGISYGRFLRDNIFVPLHMTNSGIMESKQDVVPNAIERHGTCTAQRAVQVKGAGGIYSTVEDLLVWDDALLKDSLLTPASKKKMFTPYTSAHDCPTCQSYGYGMEIDTIAGHLCYFHGGELVGMRSYNMIFPNEKLKIIILRADMGSVYFGWALAAIHFGKPVRIPSHYATTLPDSTIEKFCGFYSLDSNYKTADYFITYQHGSLFGQWMGSDGKKLKASSDSTLFYADDDFQRELVFDHPPAPMTGTASYTIHGYAAKRLYKIPVFIKE